MKFQPAPSALQLGGTRLWLAVTAVVLVTGEVGLRSSWPLLALLAVGTLLVGVGAWLGAGATGGRAVALALGCLALLAGVASWRVAVATLDPATAIRTLTGNSLSTRDRTLQAAIASGMRAGAIALQRIGTAPPDRAPDLDDLLAGAEVERAIAVVSGDTIVAVAGPNRLDLSTAETPAAVISTPFARLLVLRSGGAGRQSVVTLLLDAATGVPVAGPSLASSSGIRGGSGWRWALGLGIRELPSVDSAGALIRAAMTPIPPDTAALRSREASTARILIGIGLAALALVILLAAREPAVRAGAVLIPLWALLRSDLVAGSFGPVAVKTLLGAATLVLLALVLWRRPARRNPVGLVAAVLLLAPAPALVFVLGRAVVPVIEPDDLLGWFAWQVIIAVGTAGFLAIASAPLRAPDDERGGARWGIATAIAVALIGIVGIEAWSPAGWARWYPLCWVIPLALMVPVTAPRARLLGLATSSGVLAALVTWGASLDRRIELAARDLEGLGGPPSATDISQLEALGRAVQAGRATRLNTLFATWRASDLARRGVPAYLAVWAADGHQREVVAIDSLSVGYFDLLPLVRRNAGTMHRAEIARGPGTHEVLVVPVMPDTIATITIGPETRLIPPTHFGRLIGWRSAGEPPYRLSTVASSRLPTEGRFQRDGRFVQAARTVTVGGSSRIVRATLEMSTPRPFAVRSILVVYLDIGVILLVWLGMQRLLGEGKRFDRTVFRRSYRRMMASALAAFFIVPATGFTLWSILRLRQDATRQHTDQIVRTLRAVDDAGGFSLAASSAPREDSLGAVADQVDAEVGVYKSGRLAAASTRMLAGLGLMPPVVDPFPPVASGALASLVPPVFPDLGVRLGLERTPPTGTMVAVALPGSDTDLAREQVDLALLLLLASLIGGTAAVGVAGVVARGLAQPIEMLRRTALAIGRRELPPPVREVPTEFVPVFGAIEQMEHDLRDSEAELEAGKERTAAILATIGTGVIGVDASGRVSHANPGAERLLGVPLPVGCLFGEGCDPEWGVVIEAVRSPERPHADQIEIARGERRFAVTVTAIGDGGRVVTITDVTEASRAARIVAWGEMARQVAHEIKNPLTPMRLGLQHLRRVHEDARADAAAITSETVGRLLAEIDRLDRIARSFARYGEPPRESQHPLEPVDLHAVLVEVAELFRLAQNRPVIAVSGDTTPLVACRREELVQVLLNLIENARQADAHTVRLEAAPGAVVVRDDGTGIAESVLPHIFEPTFSTSTSGTGLGLAIVKRLVEGWGGTITVERGASGAAFRVAFAQPSGEAMEGGGS